MHHASDITTHVSVGFSTLKILAKFCRAWFFWKLLIGENFLELKSFFIFNISISISLPIRMYISIYIRFLRYFNSYNSKVDLIYLQKYLANNGRLKNVQKIMQTSFQRQKMWLIFFYLKNHIHTDAN